MAAEGAVRVLAEAVVAAYGVIGALIDIWESNERGGHQNLHHCGSKRHADEHHHHEDLCQREQNLVKHFIFALFSTSPVVFKSSSDLENCMLMISGCVTRAWRDTGTLGSWQHAKMEELTVCSRILCIPSDISQAVGKDAKEFSWHKDFFWQPFHCDCFPL